MLSLVLVGCGTTTPSPSATPAMPGATVSSDPNRIEWIVRAQDGVDARFPHFAEAKLNAAIDLDIKAIIEPAKSVRLVVRCEPTVTNAHLASVRCKIEDDRGGAHPKETAVALNHTRDGRSFGLDEMFTSDARKALSELCVDELSRQKAQWIVEGMKDVAKFLHTVNVTGTGLLVTFDPYEVGPNAEGFHEVAIRWDRVRTLIALSGPVAYAR